jgi:hypothetical protein
MVKYDDEKNKWPVLSELLLHGMSSVPLAIVSLLYLLVIHARLYLGYWPMPYRPDPKPLPFFEYYAWSMGFLLYLFVPACIVWLVLFVMRLRFRRPLGFISMVLLILPWLMIIIVVFFDPGRCLEWFCD